MSAQNILKDQREQIDRIDRQILDLLQQRKEVVQDVLKRKVEKQLPVFFAKREQDKTASFRDMAKERGLDPEWAEDFLRMVMAASRAAQSADTFPRSTHQPMRS